MSKQTDAEKIKLSTRLWPYFYKVMMIMITSTCRVRTYGDEHLHQLRQKGKPWIYSIWHNNVPISPWALRKQNTAVMVSDSKDGEIIARCVHMFGNSTLRGSSSKNASKATRQALKHLRQGYPLAITPDGPRGPKYELQDGVLWLAAAAEIDIIGFHVECSRQWEFNSWDGQKIPKPFSTIHLCFTPPIRISKNILKTDFTKTKQMLHKQMMDNVSFALEKAGRFN